MGIDELQSWATDLGERERNRLKKKDGSYEPLRLRPSEPAYHRLVPPKLRGLDPSSVHVLRRGTDQVDVVVIWGGGLIGHWGVLVVQPNQALPSLGWHYYRWRPGVYGVQF